MAPSAILTGPTAIDGQPVYSVTWAKNGRVHGVLGRSCRITLCALDFIHVAYPYTDAAIDCQRCLARIGERNGGAGGPDPQDEREAVGDP